LSRRVTFYSDGIQLVGYVYTPADLQRGEKRSGILLCHGFGAHQERYLPEIARHLSQQGYVVMTFDYRGFGESEGPHWRMIPQEQVWDIRNAVTFFRMQEEVETTCVGLYGTSFGGANVCYASAMDSRVKCVVSVVGVGCGEGWLRSLRRAWEWRAFLEELEEDRRQRVATGNSRIVERLHIMLPDPDTQANARLVEKQFPTSCTHMPLETAQAVIDYHPEEVVHRLAPRPILFIVAERDVLVPNENTREVYERAGVPKRWVAIPDIGHYDVYFPPSFHKVMAEATDWYRHYMPPKIQMADGETKEAQKA